MIPVQYQKFVDTFNEFLATFARTRQELFITINPKWPGVRGLPAEWTKASTVNLVLGLRFRKAQILSGVGYSDARTWPRISVELTFDRGEWTLVQIPLAAILFYDLRPIPETPVARPQTPAWWAWFSGGVQCTPRRPSLSDALKDGVSVRLAEWPGLGMKHVRITNPNATLRHSPDGLSVSVVQSAEIDPGQSNVIRVDFKRRRPEAPPPGPTDAA